MGLFGNWNKPGGAAEKLGQLGQLLDNPDQFHAQRAQQQRDQLGYKQALDVARIRSDATEQPSIIRTLLAAGISPDSPQGVEIIKNNLNRPNFFQVGNPESGYTVGAMGGSYGGMPPMGGGTGGSQTKVINGVTYYNVNGSWYDNPEGR